LFFELLGKLCKTNFRQRVYHFCRESALQFKRVIAQLEISYSNSMIEAVNKKIKYEFLFTRSFESFEELEKFLGEAVNEYNNRYHSALYGYTPSEVLNGSVPDKHKFSAQIAQARKERILKNKEQLCDLCNPT